VLWQRVHWKVALVANSDVRIFIYEYVTGGGMLTQPQMSGLQTALLREGDAMLHAVVEDFAKLPNIQVCTTRDARLARNTLLDGKVFPVADPEEERATFDRLATHSDWTVVIAPEFDNILFDRVSRVSSLGGRLLGPGCDIIRLTADKHATALHCHRRGFRVPEGIALQRGDPLPKDWRFPAIWKPRFGAGSQDMVLFERPDNQWRSPTEGRLEELCPGLPVSGVVLGGLSQIISLPAARQCLGEDGTFSYQGGTTPLPAALNSRATRLATRVAQSLGPFLGYVGVDMILGCNAGEDWVIEVNPRFTTSYVGMRAYVQNNLAAVMLSLAKGTGEKLTFHDHCVQFSADGSLSKFFPICNNEHLFGSDYSDN